MIYDRNEKYTKTRFTEEEIQRLKVGDTVYICKDVTFGWNTYFRYPLFVPETIKRVTPKKTKFVMESGKEFAGQNIEFYHYSEQLKHESDIAQCARKLNHLINKFNEDCKGWTKNASDDEIVDSVVLLQEVCDKLKAKDKDESK